LARSSTLAIGDGAMLIVDAGPLIAAADTDDPHHVACREMLAGADGPLLVPVLAIAETAYMLGGRLGSGAERRFAAAIQAGELLPEPVETSDWQRITELVGQYADVALGIADASVVAACERLGETKLGTLDRRHFSIIRPRHCPALELLPA
jgi:uncharacterized protein